MRPELSLSLFTRNLKNAGVKYTVFPLVNDYVILVTEHWGKVFGPFIDEKDSGALWISPKAADAESLRTMVKQGDWCIGGDRLWLAPEVQFNIPDRNRWDQGGAYVLPGAIDPGHYSLVKETGNCVTLAQEVETKLYNLAAGSKKLMLKRTFYPHAIRLRTFLNTETSRAGWCSRDIQKRP